MIESVAMTNRDKDNFAGNAAGDAGGKHDKKKPRKFSQQHGNRNRPYNNYYGKTRYHGGGNDRRHNYGKRPRFDVGERLKEVDLGITEYLGNAEGFTGTIKERFTDFVVHEISPNGEIAKLTNQELPPDPEELVDIDELKKQVTDDVWEKLQTITEDNAGIEIDVTEMDKEQRKCIHQIVKKLTAVVSETKEVGNKKLIVFSKQYANRYGSRVQDNRVDWSSRGGNYCYFILHKVNMDTMDALNQIARVCGLKSNLFTYAGTKDRRAKTTQWICVRKMNPRKIAGAARAVRGAFVGNFKFEKDPLKLGKLFGNRFTIALRNVSASDDLIEKAMVSLRNNGFINYYGLQRFGTIAAIPTYEIGKALLKGDWAEAVDLILKPREGEQDTYLSEAREIYKNTKDSRLAYQKIGGRRDKIEAKLLWGINICGQNNLQGALDMVPRNTTLMYVHAYQSYVWNLMVSRRIKEFGLKPIVGDLVYENPDSKDDAEILHEEVGHLDVDEDGKSHTEEPTDPSVDDHKTDDESKLKDESDKQASAESHSSTQEKKEDKAEDKASDKSDHEKEKPLPKVKILTKDDLPNYTMADIIMPQPGWKVTYPTYAKSWFEEILEKDGLTPDLKQKNKKYTLSGSYRKIFQVPQHLSWNIIRYNNKNQDLILSDVDELRDVDPPKNEPDGAFKALIIQMSLQSACYATMALREILKCDTSSQTHAAQSAAFHEAHEKSDDAKMKEQDKQAGSEDIPHAEKSKLERSNHEVYLSAEDLATEKKVNVSTASSALEDSMSSKSNDKGASSMLEESLLEEKTEGKTESAQKHEVDTINDSGIEPGSVIHT